MKYFLQLLIIILFAQSTFAQQTDQAYDRAMKAYKLNDYRLASTEFSKAFAKDGYGLTSARLYDGACIYAVNGENDKAMQLLNYLVTDRFYGNTGQLDSDTDLKGLHSFPGWKTLTEKAASNLATLPARTRESVKTALLKARALLQEDGGRLWGEQIWTDSLLILSPDNTVYSLQPLEGSSTTDNIIYTQKLSNGVLSQTNSSQKYKGKLYAVIMTSYLSDSSSTIIHELFHSLQFRHNKLSGEPINYLDEYRAREWLRLEYQALRNAIHAAKEKKGLNTISRYVSDALRYRKLRHQAYPHFLQNELQIETLEGLANYTGLKLSSYPDKYERTISEINIREAAASYTRTFPYATGPAYGLLFDELNMNWKQGLDQVYDFLGIYETRFLHQPLSTSDESITAANKRNNFAAIHTEEQARKEAFDQKIKNFTRIFEEQPVLTVRLKDKLYNMSYDMNGTLVFKDKGVVFTSISGTDASGHNFGSFKAANDNLSMAMGVLGDMKTLLFTFPLPSKTQGNKITGPGYEITLAKGWVVRKKNEKGDMEIVEEDSSQ